MRQKVKLVPPRDGNAIGIKPASEEGAQRRVHAAIRYALEHKR
jgi:isocitrate dehydrogenase